MSPRKKRIQKPSIASQFEDSLKKRSQEVQRVLTQRFEVLDSMRAAVGRELGDTVTVVLRPSCGEPMELQEIQHPVLFTIEGVSLADIVVTSSIDRDFCFVSILSVTGVEVDKLRVRCRDGHWVWAMDRSAVVHQICKEVLEAVENHGQGALWPPEVERTQTVTP